MDGWPGEGNVSSRRQPLAQPPLRPAISALRSRQMATRTRCNPATPQKMSQAVGALVKSGYVKVRRNDQLAHQALLEQCARKDGGRSDGD